MGGGITAWFSVDRQLVSEQPGTAEVDVEVGWVYVTFSKGVFILSKDYF